MEETLTNRNLQQQINLNRYYTPRSGNFNLMIFNRFLSKTSWNRDFKNILQVTHPHCTTGQITKSLVENTLLSAAYKDAVILTNAYDNGCGHAMTLKRSTCNGPCSEGDYTWHLLDSLKDHPQLIESENDWRNLQGSILTFQRGSVWDGLGPASDLHLADSSVPFNPNSFVYQTTFHLDTTPQTHTIQDSQSTCTTQPPLNHSIVNENLTQPVSQVNHAHSKMYDIHENPQGPLQKRKHALKIMTMNVRGLFKSHWDLCHTIAIHNPDVIVLTETKLHRSNKPLLW
jgi:hypothetical protein